MLELWLVSAALAGKADKKTPEVLVPAPPTSLHPLYAWTADDHRLHERLHLRIVDVLADVAVDGPIATVTVAKGREWSDGHPIVAADVCATIDRARADDRPSAYTAIARSRLEGCAVSAGDPSKATVTLAQGYTDARKALAIPLLPAHRRDWTAAGIDTGSAEPIGAGPWSAERSGDGWLLTGPAGRLRWRVDPDPIAAFVAGRGLEVSVPPARLAEVRAVPGVDVRVGRPIVWALFVNVGRDELADPRVREALDLLIDRDRLGLEVLGVEGPNVPRPWTPVSGPFGPKSRARSAGIPVPVPDPERARALLAEAGVDPATWELSLAVPQGRAPEGFAAALAAELGAKVQEVVLDPAQWWFSLEGGAHARTTDLALVPLAPDDPGPWLHTRTASWGTSNPFGFSHWQADRLIEQLAQGDLAAGQELHGVLADERPALFLWYTEERIASRITP